MNKWDVSHCKTYAINIIYIYMQYVIYICYISLSIYIYICMEHVSEWNSVVVGSNPS